MCDQFAFAVCGLCTCICVCVTVCVTSCDCVCVVCSLYHMYMLSACFTVPSIYEECFQSNSYIILDTPFLHVHVYSVYQPCIHVHQFSVNVMI